jgi:hypothetical protein
LVPAYERKPDPPPEADWKAVELMRSHGLNVVRVTCPPLTVHWHTKPSPEEMTLANEVLGERAGHAV